MLAETVELGVIRHLVDAELVAEIVEEVVAGVGDRLHDVDLAVGVFVGRVDPALGGVAVVDVLGELTFGLQRARRGNDALGEQRRSGAGLERGAGGVNAHERAVIKRGVLVRDERFVIFQHRGGVVGRIAYERERLAGIDLHDAQRAAGDHFGALGAVHFGFRNDAGALFVDRLDVRGERLLAHFLQADIQRQIDMPAGLRLLGVLGAERDAVEIGVDLRLAVHAVEIFLKGVFHAVLADVGVERVVLAGVGRPFLRRQLAGVAEQVGGVLRFVFAHIGRGELKAGNVLLHEIGEQRHRNVLGENVGRGVDVEAVVDLVPDADDAPGVLGVILAADAVARTHRREDLHGAGVERHVVRLEPGVEHALLQRVHLGELKGRGLRDGQRVGIGVTEALHGAAQLENDRVRVVLTEELRYVDRQVVAERVGHEQTPVAVENVPSRRGDGDVFFRLRFPYGVVFAPADDLQLIKRDEVNAEQQHKDDGEHNEPDGFYHFLHGKFLSKCGGGEIIYTA